ncbi:hypothetical protein ACFOU0_01260 [Salinicoccus sesuvii]|uniref:Uncharacterized protein n=1 Tax=Salinicoccus sesuvii TaxID=868281 RepID=A0ABV7N0X1_9STAP
MKSKFDDYKDRANDYIKKNKYDEKAQEAYKKGQDYFEEKGGKQGVIDYLKSILPGFHHGENKAILIVSTIVIFISSIWAYDNVHRHGIGPSYSDTNKEKVAEMKRASEVYDWD